jgi:hypothetical protein
MAVSRQSLETIYEFLQLLPVRVALQEAADEEVQDRVALLRNAIRQSRATDAAILEGEIAVLENLTAVLLKYAHRYSPPSRV